ncbi:MULTISPECIES: GNAT family N-acetyltransferase [Pantoea]|jgi:GNAT superfamily N-acetyltransferase|uniref:GNAT family N-acetyltransferase n=1 Tax=Pantoea piersonii TaxID=2364647 RepID=A0AAJ5QHA5_9GAMM|nr:MULTISPECIES: GNAT family N-acetyltransferase [Pantoea]MDU6432757.1 GNAT family N-acetyltransferase [Pantoea sp.]MBZ6385852.1 GNAT family N-acetyltransferase [Pantoea piersonii]MBZ6401008.1 GNAT family N-acetyltransferase [Pantoea piersonii]MBZ6410449.1 GNAT family N-acetyltransferase [Pantoea piersonii]MBZ6429024.1 GNAT family N-acetyltransferase [Pantoea piersonii]
MNIRQAQAKDSFALSALLAELGYGGTESFIDKRLAQLSSDPDEMLLVAEHGTQVLGFLSMHFIPQLALAGDFARISYFCIAEGERSKGVGQQLLQHAEAMAAQRGCDRMEVHCHASRLKANQFYMREGYVESPRYHIKGLN